MNFRWFPSFFKNPAKIKFIEQEPTEEIILFLRQHGIVNLPWILLSILAIFLPPVFLQLDLTFNTNFFTAIPTQILVGGLAIYYMLVLAFILEQFLFWYYNIYIVTNLHLVDINFYSILSRNIIELEFRDIESVSTDIKGIFGSFFNYGDVIVRTAAEKQPVIFSRVPRPDQVADTIQDLQIKTHNI